MGTIALIMPEPYRLHDTWSPRPVRRRLMYAAMMPMDRYRPVGMSPCAW